MTSVRICDQGQVESFASNHWSQNEGWTIEGEVQGTEQRRGDLDASPTSRDSDRDIGVPTRTVFIEAYKSWIGIKT